MTAGIIRPSTTTDLSPSNLVEKLLEGRTLTDTFHMVVDQRELNKLSKDLYFPIPKIDEIVHVLAGATFFAKTDNTSGY